MAFLHRLFAPVLPGGHRRHLALIFLLAALPALPQTLTKANGGGTPGGGSSVGTTAQKGDGSGGFLATSITDNGTTVTTPEALQALSASTGDGTTSGISCASGSSSGQTCFAAADTAGSAFTYVWPTTNGTSGQYLKDNGSVTCPTLPAGMPATCHQLVWTSLAIPTLPQNPIFSDTDAVCALTGGTPACPTGGVVMTAIDTPTPFQSTLVLGTGVPATNKVIRWTIGMDFTAQGTTPNIGFLLKACLQANYNIASGACSGGGVTLWTGSFNSANTALTAGVTGQSLMQFTIQGGGSNLLYSNLSTLIGGGLKGTSTSVSSPTKVSFTNSGTWVVALFVQYHVATAGNWTQVTQSIAEALN